MPVAKTPPRVSAKSHKLLEASTSKNLPKVSEDEFEILDFKQVCKGFKEVLACKKCGEVDITSGRCALGFKIEVQCQGVCSKNLTGMDSCKQIGPPKKPIQCQQKNGFRNEAYRSWTSGDEPVLYSHGFAHTFNSRSI